MTLRAVILGLALAVGALAAPAADATTLANLTDEQLVDASTYIVRGTVQEVWVEFDTSDMIWTRAKVKVDQTFKGPDAPETLIVDSMGGQIGDRWVDVPSAARFSEGENVVLFLATIKHGERLTPVEMFRGKYTIRRAPGDTRQIVQRFQVPQHDVYDHRFIPHPAVEHRVYLDDLMQRVESRLHVGWDGQKIPGLSPEQLTEINAPARRRIVR